MANISDGGAPAQIALFASQDDREIRKKLNLAIDAIDEKFGNLAVRPASLIGAGETTAEEAPATGSDEE